MRWTAAGLAVTAMAGVCEGRERHTVTVSYVIGPERELPEGLRAVAVIDSGVQAMGVPQSEREQKWSMIAADMIEAMLHAGGQWGDRLNVAKRSETQRVLAEHDLRLAGLIEGVTAAQAGRLLAVQGLVTSRITINVDIQRGRRSTIDWMQIMGGLMSQTRQVRPAPAPAPRQVLGPVSGSRKVYRQPRYKQDSRKVYYGPAGPTKKTYPPGAGFAPAPSMRGTDRSGHFGLSLATREVEEISRSLTVQCSFSLIDAVTGETILQYSPPPCQKQDKASPDFLFGRTIDEADLDPVDHFIGELVEQTAQEFVAMLVPVHFEAPYELVGKDDEGEAGIRALRADDYETALQQFEAWFRRKHDHRAVFNLGVTCELMGDSERALQFYRQAAAMEKLDKDELALYMSAKDRLTKHINRIIRPEAVQPALIEPGG